MGMNSINLAWVVVSDLEKAKKFYVDMLGLKLHTYDEQFGWLECEGLKGGARLGISKEGDPNMKAGRNAVVTFTVDDIVKARDELSKKGVRLLGDIMEVPGHVKLQTFSDPDGNIYQIVETIGEGH